MPVADPLPPVARRAAAAVLAGAAVVLVAWLWAAGHPDRLVGVLADIRAKAAIGLGLLAASWLWPDAAPTRTGTRRRWREVGAPWIAARACACVVAVAAVVTVIEYATTSTIGFDRLPVLGDHTPPDRLRLLTALCLLPLAVARLTPLGAAASTRIREVCGFGTIIIGGVAALGYVFHEAALNPQASIAFLPLLTSLGVLALGSVTLLSVPDGVAAWVASGRDVGAMFMRRVLPPALLSVPAINVAVVLARRWNWIGLGAGAPIAAVAIMVVVGLSVAYTATALRRSDADRAQVSRTLATVNDDLERRVTERAQDLQSERSTTAVLLDRERIAADMHDIVIQRLYAVALELQGRAAVAGFDADMSLDGIDDAIADLRRTIAELKTAPAAGGANDQLTALGDDAGHPVVRVQIRGDLDALPVTTSTHLLAVAREAVSNAVRHADADRVDVDAVVTASGLTLTVTDDGRGIPPGTESTSGLRNMRDRATQLGGLATWQAREGGGTTVVWHAPAAMPEPDAPRTRTEHLTRAVGRLAASFADGTRTDRLTAAGIALRDLIGARRSHRTGRRAGRPASGLDRRERDRPGSPRPRLPLRRHPGRPRGQHRPAGAGG